MDKIMLGSQTAKNGFLNEEFVVNEFNSWQKSDLARDCLIKMGYDLNEIEYVWAEKIKGSYKADLQVRIQITIKLKTLIDAQNLSVKLVSNPQGFNQIDKRWVATYKKLWGFDDEIERILKLYTGEIMPYKSTRDSRRMFFDEMNESEINTILQWFERNQILILSDILKGSGKFAAEWFLVVLKVKNEPLKWEILSMNETMNFYAGKAQITKQGNLKLGKITIQRKGGDNGRESAKMLQFKLNPCEIFKRKESLMMKIS